MRAAWAMIAPRRVLGYLGGGMGKGAAGLALLTVVSSVVSYAGTMALSRLLKPTGFGDLMSLLALGIIIAVPAVAVQTVVASRIAHWQERGTEEDVARFIRHAFAHMLVIGAAVTITYVLCIPLVVEGFALQAPGPAIALAPLVGLSFLFALLSGVLQGKSRFVALGGLILVVTVMRFGVGVAWAAVGGGAGGAIAGQSLGVALVSLVVLWWMRDLVAGSGTGAATAGLRRLPDVRTLSASTGFLSIAVLSTLDLVLAKGFMPPVQAGLYAALSVIGKAVLFLPIALSQVVVPPAVSAETQARAGNAVLRRTAVPITLSCVVIGLPLIMAPTFSMSLLFGQAYAAAGPGVLPMVLAATAFSLLFLTLTMTVAIGDQRWALLLIPGIALQIGGIWLFHGSASQVAWVQACVITSLLIVNEIGFYPLLLRAPWLGPRRRGALAR